MPNENLRCFRIFRSGIPDKSVPLMLGIDEAGRGPVLGPMVYGGFVCAIDGDHDRVLKREIGVDDSKKLTAVSRDAKFRQLNTPDRQFAICAEVLTPKFISYKMLQRDSVNLNMISHNSAISIIRHFLSQGFNLKEVYIDAVGSTSKYEEKLKRLFPDLRCVVAIKADSKYPVVSAASIVAKVIRDNMIDTWFKNSDTPIAVGSGYPGDEVTRKLLTSTVDKVFGFSEFVRVSWATAKNILEDSTRITPFEWYDPDDDADSRKKERQGFVIPQPEYGPFHTLQRVTHL